MVTVVTVVTMVLVPEAEHDAKTSCSRGVSAVQTAKFDYANLQIKHTCERTIMGNSESIQFSYM